MDSSWIHTISHDAATGTLSVELTTGTIYDYHDVPKQVALDFKQADSKGGYHNANIRDVYHYETR